MTRTEDGIDAAARLRAWREFFGISQRDLAQRLVGPDGRQLVSHASLSRYEAGSQAVKVEKIIVPLAQFYGVSPGTLLDYPPPQPLGRRPEKG